MKKAKFIPVTGPWITQKEVDYVARAAKDGWHKNHQKYIIAFEKKFANYVGRKYGVATSCCTAALHLAYIALDIKKGDEVIVPNITWIATAAPLYWMGVKPVFADIEPDSWCIDAADIERKITKRTRAIVIVDLYGNIPDMRRILRIARRYRLRIIEDAAQAVGAEYYGKKAGSFGDISCFSFQGAKLMVTGEGGMFLTDSKKLADRARFYRHHCIDTKSGKAFWNTDIGYQYKMSNLQAACGLAQLERINELISKKRKIFSWYKKRLGEVPGLKLNIEKPHTKNSYWMVTVVFDKKYGLKKERIIAYLNEFGIHSRPFFYPLSQLPAIKEKAITPVAFDISRRAINLPSGLKITEKDVGYICDVILSLLHNLRKKTKYFI